jgi:outer membrane lipoprotein-sorting protein
MICTVLTALAMTLAPPKDPAAIVSVGRVLQQMKEANGRISDLRCSFTAEVVKEGRPLPIQQTVFRYRSRPELIHLTFLSPHGGRKVCLRRDEKGEHLRVRPDGVFRFMTLSLDPRGGRAMEEAIDPITLQGFPNIVAAAEALLGSDQYNVALDTVPPTPGSSGFLRIRFQASDTETFLLEVDSRTLLPHAITRRSGSNFAVYRYEKIEVNPGLSDSEFEL